MVVILSSALTLLHVFVQRKIISRTCNIKDSVLFLSVLHVVGHQVGKDRETGKINT